MIVVCPLNAVNHVIEKYNPSHLVTLLNVDMMIDTPSGLRTGSHLKLSMNDIDAPADGLVAANEDQIRSLIDFIDSWDRTSSFAIHCWAGISRSTAAAFVTLCRLHPNRDENEIAAQLRASAPFATPNRLIVHLADEALGRQGRMYDAIERIGRGADAWEGEVFELDTAPGHTAAAGASNA